ncbi:MAG: PAS domain-containing protein [Arcobacteraceae bacterium]|nr:PAS domain-containing protein [Arcobacteraceae bacterium]
MKLKFIMLFIFIIVYGLFLYINTQSKNERIELALNKQIKNLEIHYDLTKDYFLTDAKNIRKYINNNKKVIDIFSEAQNTTEIQKDILRKKLYKLLIPMYKRIMTRGILQFQFVFPDNTNFLRMHKPNKYGDDLTNIRYSFKYVNETRKDIEGFEQGRTTHAFRYVFPFFSKFDTSANDKREASETRIDKNKYLGAVEISLSSNSLQDKLLNVNKIHSHFLVKKDVIDVKTWKTKDLITKYTSSIEHKDYMFALIKQSNMDNLKYSKKNIIEHLKDKIAYNISLKKSFAVYSPYKDSVIIITFLPIKNIQRKEVVAYIVSYTDNDNIYNISKNYKTLNIVIFISMLFLFYFIYKNINHKKELEIEVEEKTKDLKYLNDNLENKVIEKTKEQDVLLSLFDKGDSILFKWNNDEHWSVEYVSSSVKKLLGYDQSDFTNNKISYDSCIHKDDLNKVMEEVSTGSKLNKDFFKHEPYRIVTKKGDIKWVIDYTVIVRDDNNHITHYLGYINDVTQEKNKEKLLAEQLKLASMGDMIGNIAHQWRQPLNIIGVTMMKLEMINDMKFDEDESVKKIIADTNNSLGYLSKTIDDFRNFIKGDSEKTIFILKDNISSFLNLVDPNVKNDKINIILELQEDIKIEGYPNELTQCFVNIFNNSKDAFKELNEDDRYIFISTIKENRNIIIKFKDSGGGIPEDILRKIFEPYFTTKHKSQGTGLGLHMTYNLIVDGMKGTIEAHNVKFQYNDKNYTGAEFTIILPIV